MMAPTSEQTEVATAALHFVSPLIRERLLDTPDFLEEYGIVSNPEIVFGGHNTSIPRSDFLNAIRSVLSELAECRVRDLSGREWVIQVEKKNDSEQKLIVICHEKMRFALADFGVLSPDSASRLIDLEKSASDVNLPDSESEYWRNILRERSLNDEEVDKYHGDFRDTPVHVGRLIRNEINSGKCEIATLVPISRKYYDRLVGVYDASNSVREYAVGGARQHINKLIDRDPYEGFLLSLVLSSHPSLTCEIGIDHLRIDDLNRAFDFLVADGDRLSQLGAIEIGLRMLPERPEVEPHLLRLVEKIRDDDIESSVSGLRLFSALFVLVDGELSRIRLFSDSPPFYRRLASLAQAALIQRQLVNSAVDETFYKWAFGSRTELFYYQSLVDMRLEPRWDPNMAIDVQLKAEFLGRIMNAVAEKSDAVKQFKIHELALGKESGSLPLISDGFSCYLPGPLEGASDSTHALPAEYAQEIEQQLNAAEIEPQSFVALVNSAMLFSVDSDQAEMAAKALRIGNYQLANIADETQLLATLKGLATVASAARNEPLSKELRVLVRKYRNEARYQFPIEEVVTICLTAAACHSNQSKWRDFVGDWITEIAFTELEHDEAVMLLRHLTILLHTAPVLWVSCAKAEAALQAFCTR